MKVIVIAALEVDEGSCNLLVRTIVPVCLIWSGTKEYSGSHATRDLASKVSTIDRVQTHRPRQIETSDARNPAGGRVVVKQLDGVGPIEIVLHGFLIGLGIRGQPSSPVALQVPVSAGNLSRVRVE